MIKVCKENKKGLTQKMMSNNFDFVAMSQSNLVDDIILSMHQNKILECLTKAMPDKRAHNTTIPFDLVLALSVAAKMKTKTSLSDIPYAITDHCVLSELGYNIIDTDKDLKTGMMRESSLRFLFGKYEADELFKIYDNAVQNYIMPKLDIVPNIHILDCTEISVNTKNENYEKAAYTTNKYGDIDRGYKLATIRGLVDDTGIIEEIRFDAMNVHDLKLSEEMLRTTKVFKPEDILIEDRGFLDRDLINYLKSKKKVDTYVPLRSNMNAYQIAIQIAQEENKWEPHPSRENQKIAFVSNLKNYWWSDRIQSRKKYNDNEDVEINACVVWDTETDNYFVFCTTDTTVSAKQIILTYELRPEIEEDYRQLKDFWLLEDFHSTKLNMIALHTIMVLFGYLFFQLYTLMPEGEQYSHKSLPVILKNYQPTAMPYLIFYSDDEFGIFGIAEIIELHPSCSTEAQKRLLQVLK
ncbi:MAG: transposase [Lachnospiraceae bacterium]